MPLDPITISALAGGIGQMTNLGMGIADRNRAERQNQAANNMNIMLARNQARWNLNQWHRENRYNTPAQQMARFKEAGLNPHLIYGQGNPGNASSVMSAKAPEIKSVDSGVRAFSDSIGGFQQGVQTNLVAQQINLSKQEQFNKAVAAQGMAYDNIKKGAEAGIAPEMAKYSLEAAAKNIEKTQAEIDNRNIQTDTLTKTQASKVLQELRRANNLKLDGQGKITQNELLRIQKKLEENGVTKQDSILIRALIQSGITPEQILEKMRHIFPYNPWN
jgi:hypothetical protein